MSEEKNDAVVKNEDGLKIRKLTELRPTAGKEYKEAMLNRVDYFSEKYKNESIFNNITENTIVKGMSTILELKTKVDDMLGDNKETVQDVLQKVLLFGL
ncbi:MAG: hypothetical protein ACOC44_08185 [Promethearchaeia archaeon]